MKIKRPAQLAIGRSYKYLHYKGTGQEAEERIRWMERQVELKNISDGKLYSLNDMVKADCGDCKGCSACCRGMGASIILDPLDIRRLTLHTGCSFMELLKNAVELRVVDGLILPNLRMNGEGESCVFLNKEGRCRIHKSRPGFCRLFPLGRYYENRSFQYFLQVHECRNENRTKVKVRKWIDTPEVKRYERFVNDWHYFLRDIQACLKKAENIEAEKSAAVYLLRKFYETPFEYLPEKEGGFYQEFDERLKEAREYLEKTVKKG